MIGKLTMSERIRIVHNIIGDMIRTDKTIDKVWAQEASNRWSAYKNGTEKPVSYEDVMAKYKKA